MEDYEMILGAVFREKAENNQAQAVTRKRVFVLSFFFSSVSNMLLFKSTATRILLAGRVACCSLADKMLKFIVRKCS